MTKQCSTCKKVKDLTMFYRDKLRKDGRKYNCKACSEIFNKRWRKNNPEKYSQYNCTPRKNEAMKLKSKLRSRQHRHDMSDMYIRNLLAMNVNLKPKDIPKELVECHRTNLKLKRMLKLTRKLKPT